MEQRTGASVLGADYRSGDCRYGGTSPDPDPIQANRERTRRNSRLTALRVNVKHRT